MKADHVKTTATTEEVSSHPGENGCWSQEWRRNTTRAGQKPREDWKNDLKTYEAGRESQKPPTLVVGNKPNGKSRLKAVWAVWSSFGGGERQFALIKV
jgi:hypothetical protein